MKSVITIARQYGSGGREIGKKLAGRFGIPFYDRELIAEAAKRSGWSREILEQADEKAGSSLLYAMIMNYYPFSDGVPPASTLPVNDKLFLLQADLIREAAQSGPCVIVGRCADDILRGEKNVFSVFVHADLEFRRQRAVSDYGIGPGDAAAQVARMDKQRAGYYNFYTDKKWEQAENYHLAVSTSCFGVDGAVELIAAAVAEAEKRRAGSK